MILVLIEAPAVHHTGPGARLLRAERQEVLRSSSFSIHRLASGIDLKYHKGYRYRYRCRYRCRFLCHPHPKNCPTIGLITAYLGRLLGWGWLDWKGVRFKSMIGECLEADGTWT